MNSKIIDNIKASANHLMEVVKDLESKKAEILKGVESLPDMAQRKEYTEKFNKAMADLESKKAELNKQLYDLNVAKEKMK